jgi:hypothetical protein
VAEGRVYFGTGAGHLHCVSAMAGAICPPPPPTPDTVAP